MRQLLTIPHRRRLGMCPVNGIRDLVQWRSGRDWSNEFLWGLGQGGGFAYLRFSSADPPRQVYTGIATPRQHRYLAALLGADFNEIENRAFIFSWDKAREAVASYLKLEYLYPNNPLLPYAHYNRARLLYQELSDNQNAIEVCSQIVSAYPASEYASASLFMLGEIKEKKTKDYDGAIAAYRKLVDTYPQYVKSVNALLSIGEINSKKLKNYSVAIIAYNEFIEKYQSSPRGVEALEAIGDIYNENLKDYSKAAEYYGKIAELYPTYDKAPNMLLKAGALCEDKLSEHNKAIEYYQLVVDKYPESKKAGDAAKKIAKAKEKAGN